MTEHEIGTLKGVLRYLLESNDGYYKTHPQRLLVSELNEIIVEHGGENLIEEISQESIDAKNLDWIK